MARRRCRLSRLGRLRYIVLPTFRLTAGVRSARPPGVLIGSDVACSPRFTGGSVGSDTGRSSDLIFWFTDGVGSDRLIKGMLPISRLTAAVGLVGSDIVRSSFFSPPQLTAQ